MANTKSQDFRRVFANTFSISFTGTENQILFGVQHTPGSKDLDMEEQVAVFMSPSGTKLMAELLTLIIRDYEEATGQPIPMDETKLNPLKEQIAARKLASGGKQ